MYCRLNDLSNEASVETFFITRMLADFGYKDKHIKTKEALKKLGISPKSKRGDYKPDYCIVLNRIPRLVIDAKAPTEDIYDWVEKCAHYCLVLNRKFKRKPVRHFILSNGIRTGLFPWDAEEAILELDFADFVIGNEKYEKLRNLVARNNLIARKTEQSLDQKVKLKRIDKEDAQKLFLSCHKYIWKAEKRSPASAFMEFIKIIFLKLWHDRLLHEPPGDSKKEIEVPKTSVTFSVRWIESRESDTTNPLSDLQFRKLLQQIEEDITKNNKKRIFDADDTINLRPQTIKGVVKKLERVDLFGIDEDLNGRLFETFLSATMRGKALGQFFTPRSIVLLATRLADLQANKRHIDKVLDASCGTGGFLIEALAEMRNQIRRNDSYSNDEKSELISKLCADSLYGIDDATDPQLTRIARINMYLHGDGGSHIYKCDGLDNEIIIHPSDSIELQAEIRDLRNNFNAIRGFDVVLTNPPFSMWYELANEDEARILKQYELLKIAPSSARIRSRMRSSAMFMERYYRLLKAGGKILTVIDETVLSSDDYAFVRDYIRKHFVIKAVISLHGDAFRMSGSRVKTALMYLEKKKRLSESQPAAFMYPSIYLGVDDLPVTSSKAKIEKARQLANAEIINICSEFTRFKDGLQTKWVVPPEKLRHRLDLKYCLSKPGRLVPKWRRAGHQVVKLSELAEPVTTNQLRPNDFPNKQFPILRIRYDGRIEISEIRMGKDINYKTMIQVKSGDLVFSEYNSIYGAIGFITPEFENALASGSYTVARCDHDYDTLYLWAVLRTTELRNDMLARAIGMGRQTIKWEDIKEIQLPLPDKPERIRIFKEITGAWQKEREIAETFENLNKNLDTNFLVESRASQEWFQANKPPR